MGVLQRWLDEPDQSIARFAKAFYVLTFAFMATFLGGMVVAVVHANQARAAAGDFIQPSVSLFLTLTMYCLALDGRRSYKALNARTGPR